VHILQRPDLGKQARTPPKILFGQVPASEPENRLHSRKWPLRYRPGRLKPKPALQGIEDVSEFRPENLSPKTSLLSFERVNDFTFKITNGELTNVPASHGQWSGYRTKKALAWIIKLEADSWLARCGDQVCGPSSFVEAKADALAMAKDADGDYFVRNTISHLNGLQARLLDKKNSSK